MALAYPVTIHNMADMDLAVGINGGRELRVAGRGSATSELDSANNLTISPSHGGGVMHHVAIQVPHHRLRPGLALDLYLFSGHSQDDPNLWVLAEMGGAVDYGAMA